MQKKEYCEKLLLQVQDSTDICKDVCQLISDYLPIQCCFCLNWFSIDLLSDQKRCIKCQINAGLLPLDTEYVDSTFMEDEEYVEEFYPDSDEMDESD